MSIQKLRNKFSVGAYIKKIAEIWDKVNEIIDNLNGNGATGSGSYKVYSAVLSQTGLSAPVATVLENTLGGTVTWSYVSPGTYYATVGGLFTLNKTFILNGNQADAKTTYYITDVNEIQFFTYVDLVTLSNDMLFTTAVEIRVYN